MTTILTTKLNNGLTVLAKMYKGELCAMTYSNRKQASTKVAELGEGWYVSKGLGRPFYVAYNVTADRFVN